MNETVQDFIELCIIAVNIIGVKTFFMAENWFGVGLTISMYASILALWFYNPNKKKE